MHVRDVRFLDNDCMLVPSTCDTMKFVALESIRPSEKLDRSKLQAAPKERAQICPCRRVVG